MFNLFKKNHSPAKPTASTALFVQPLCHPFLDFEQFVKGINNVHIDVYLSPRFTELSHSLISELLNERSSTKRRFTDKPSTAVLTKLEAFNTSYASMLTAAIHRAAEKKRLDSVQLFQIAVVKLLLTTVQTQANQLLNELRKATIKDTPNKLALSERIAWINRHKDSMLYQVTFELFEQIHWAESGAVGKLRESKFGVTWSIPEEMLFNPLLQSSDTRNHEVLMKHYVLLSENPNSRYSFEYLSDLIDKLLEDIASLCHVQVEPWPEKPGIPNSLSKEIRLSWKDIPANMDELFNLQETQYALENELPEQQAALKIKLNYQHKANKLLKQGLHQAQIITHLLAAYETPRLHEHYAKLLKPYLVCQALCGDASLFEFTLKLQNQLKLRPLRRSTDKPLSINELKNSKKRLTKLARNPDNKILRHFITDFVAYRRDLKYHRLMHEAMKQINLLSAEADVQLSRSNSLLHEFLEQQEYTTTFESIRCHLIVKADLRGSTTMTTALCERGLNPATHFSLNFFNPIRKSIKDFGAEKVFIEGDAVILSLFEYQNAPEQWVAVARACGLAKSMLAVVQKQNEVSRAHNLPELELGIGICYSPEAPHFLYDGEQRIMISPAIGDADRLSSCSWKLRRKYSQQSNLLTRVMVFQQPPDDAFKGEKGMTTFRYNLNGVELQPAAFNKLQSEIALRQFKLRLPGDKYNTRFYVGEYPDTTGEIHKVVIREAQVKVWQEDSEDYPLTDILYYEVVTNKTILNTLKKRGG